MRKLLSPRSWPEDVGVGVVLIGMIGLITLVMTTMVVLFSLHILV